MAQLGVRLLLESDAEYPPGLREIADPPLLLSMRGELQPGDRVAVAIVGTRRATAYGRRMAERLAGDLALRGITVVSGLARGIDGVAHEAALAANGRTIAVLASGLQRIYPPEHHELAERIVQSGALLTEAPLDGPPLGQLFPKRNRIISGMSLGVVVVEAGVKSGALSTAMHALHQNREVFAVPGRVGDGGSEGTHLLLRQGAALVTSVQDIVDQLGPIELPASPVDPRLAIDPPASVSLTSPVEHRILAELGDDPIALEELLEKANVSAAEASAAILVMETKRLVRRLPGNRYARARS
jgi:DNA processing protein